MGDIRISHAEAFNKWYSERMGHPFAVQLGKNAVDELQQENAELREALQKTVTAIYSHNNEMVGMRAVMNCASESLNLLNKNDN